MSLFKVILQTAFENVVSLFIPLTVFLQPVSFLCRPVYRKQSKNR